MAPSDASKVQRIYEEAIRARCAPVPRFDIVGLTDRGFGDLALYSALGGANFDFAIRFRGNIRLVSAKA